MTHDDWKLAHPPEYDSAPLCGNCDDTGCPECRGEPEPDDDTPLCNCGTCTPPDFPGSYQ